MALRLIAMLLALVIAGQFVIVLFRLFEPQETQTISVAVFDAETALNSFVRWSSTNISDDRFSTALPAFQAAVAQEINHFSLENNTIIVRPGAVLTPLQSAPSDVTDMIMERVLADAAF